MSLSDKRGRSEILGGTLGIYEEWWYGQENVKEFIRALEDAIDENMIFREDGEPAIHGITVHKLIKKFAGEELT